MGGDDDPPRPRRPARGAGARDAAGGRCSRSAPSSAPRPPGWRAGWTRAGASTPWRPTAAAADRAEAFFAAAGIADRIRVHRGPAVGDAARASPTAPTTSATSTPTRPGYAGYLEHAVRLVRPGGLIVADNVLAGGRVGAARADERDAERGRARRLHRGRDRRTRACAPPSSRSATASRSAWSSSSAPRAALVRAQHEPAGDEDEEDQRPTTSSEPSASATICADEQQRGPPRRATIPTRRRRCFLRGPLHSRRRG